ncbi:DUF1090 family protein [Stutzerimonas nitrititolerans]|uniref:DUF1090 family protein n=1 Tax=Stutzerimonas nitrititolerans TaxID=2482751 RepID=UPI0028A1D228|nr:DUF1090 family protein [Stutzerimonas nitrititolerans]
MPAKRTITLPLLASLAVGQMLWAAEPPADCGERRKALGEQLTEARLQGDKVRLSTLEERLQTLNKDCRGLVPLQSNQADVERASQLTSEREARLREALGAGDRQVIDLRREQLDQARRALEAAKH